MDCPDCPRYDPEVQGCKDGKLNPYRYDLAVEVAQVYGVRAICMYNDFREQVIAQGMIRDVRHRTKQQP